MNKLCKYIFQVFLVALLLTPSVVKLLHHHEESLHCLAKTGKHLHNVNDECPACNFEFSVFFTSGNCVISSDVDIIDNYRNIYKSFEGANFRAYAFLLRAPPATVIL